VREPLLVSSTARRRLKRVGAVLVIAVVVEYLVVPQLSGARRTLHLLSDVNVAWLVAGLAFEGAAIVCYAELTRTLLPEESRPSLGRLVRITLSTLGLSHVVPGGPAVGNSLGYRLLTNEGVKGTDAGFALATQGIGSAVVLNVLLWIGLVVSIPIRGFNPIYVTAAIVGSLLLAFVGIAVLLLTKGEDYLASRLSRLADRLPLLRGDAVADAMRDIAGRLRELGSSSGALWRAVRWAALNWLFDMAALWVFLAAFGYRTSPDAILISYGLANVLAAIPLTPGGLGVVEAALSASLVGFGATRGVAVLGVVTYRAVNFWLPIPAGAVAYLTLRSGGDREPGALRRVAEEAADRSPPSRAADERS
jgi:uncharacterized protein (TIRG00374 family)